MYRSKTKLDSSMLEIAKPVLFVQFDIHFLGLIDFTHCPLHHYQASPKSPMLYEKAGNTGHMSPLSLSQKLILLNQDNIHL